MSFPTTRHKRDFRLPMLTNPPSRPPQVPARIPHDRRPPSIRDIIGRPDRCRPCRKRPRVRGVNILHEQKESVGWQVRPVGRFAHLQHRIADAHASVHHAAGLFDHGQFFGADLKVKTAARLAVPKLVQALMDNRHEPIVSMSSGK